MGQGAPPIDASARCLPACSLHWSPPRALPSAQPKATDLLHLILLHRAPRGCGGRTHVGQAVPTARRMGIPLTAGLESEAAVDRSVPAYGIIAALRGGCDLLAVRRLPARPVTVCHPSWGGMEEVRREAVATLGGVTGDGASAPAALRQW